MCDHEIARRSHHTGYSIIDADLQGLTTMALFCLDSRLCAASHLGSTFRGRAAQAVLFAGRLLFGRV